MAIADSALEIEVTQTGVAGGDNVTVTPGGIVGATAHNPTAVDFGGASDKGKKARHVGSPGSNLFDRREIIVRSLKINQ
jgi:hypothetical protein